VLTRISHRIDKPLARFGLALFGIILMLAVAPIAPYIVGAALSWVDWSNPAELSLLAIVFGVVFGILAAWVRVLTTSALLVRHVFVRVALSVCLLAGLLATASCAALIAWNSTGSTYLLIVCLFASFGALLLLLGTVSP